MEMEDTGVHVSQGFTQESRMQGTVMPTAESQLIPDETRLSGDMRDMVNVRTNWATFPPESNSQCVVITKAQCVKSTLSVPVGRFERVFGPVKSTGRRTVLVWNDLCTASHQVQFRMYKSQPTQVFLQDFERCLKANGVKPWSTLCFEPYGLGACRLVVWPQDHAQSVAFKHSLIHSWSGFESQKPRVNSQVKNFRKNERKKNVGGHAAKENSLEMRVHRRRSERMTMEGRPLLNSTQANSASFKHITCKDGQKMEERSLSGAGKQHMGSRRKRTLPERGPVM